MLQAIPQLPTVRHSMNHYPYPAHAVAASHDDGKIHLLLGASGSVAVIKLPLIARALLKHTPPSVLSIRIVLTPSATKFLAGQSPEQPTVSALGHIDGVDGVYTDKDEWGPEPWRRGQPILHVELRKWAHVFVIAPLGANSLAEIVEGRCAGLLTSVVRAWDATGRVDGLVEMPVVVRDPPATNGNGTNGHAATEVEEEEVAVRRVRKRIIVALAMNTAMYEHPVTARQVKMLEEEWGVKDVESMDDEDEKGGWFEVIRPQADKKLACGDIGAGAMREWTEVVSLIERRLGVV